MTRVEIAIKRIKDILVDDANYQTDSLKLGAIWNYCEWTASFKRLDTTEGQAIEVIVNP